MTNGKQARSWVLNQTIFRISCGKQARLPQTSSLMRPQLYKGIKLQTDKGIFPPDFGVISCYTDGP